MVYDIFLTFGIIAIICTFPSFLMGWTQGRLPRIALGVFVIASLMVIYAVTSGPGGYTAAEIPSIMFQTLKRLVGA